MRMVAEPDVDVGVLFHQSTRSGWYKILSNNDIFAADLIFLHKPFTGEIYVYKNRWGARGDGQLEISEFVRFMDALDYQHES